jgi:hypothetical protein
MDAPPSGDSTRPPFTSFVATYIDILATEYGWSRDAVLDLPLAQLYQLVREALPHYAARKRVKIALINRKSDKVKSNWLNASTKQDT